MDDAQIINLYFARDENAIVETKNKYQNMCYIVAHNILYSREDSEECVNDTWLFTWNSIPPRRPSILSSFVSKITRNTAIDRYRKRNAQKLRQIKVIKGDLESVLAQRCKDYVTVILTDKVDLDVIDMQDRLRLAFPGLLEIRRETVRQVDYTRHADSERELNPFELCCQFLGNADAEEQEILQEVINTVQEVTK